MGGCDGTHRVFGHGCGLPSLGNYDGCGGELHGFGGYEPKVRGVAGSGGVSTNPVRHSSWRECGDHGGDGSGGVTTNPVRYYHWREYEDHGGDRSDDVAMNPVRHGGSGSNSNGSLDWRKSEADKFGGRGKPAWTFLM